MSVRCAGCGLQYAGQRGPGGAGRRAAPGPRALPADARRGTRGSTAPPAGLLASDDRTLGPDAGQFLPDGGFSGYFTAHFALPLVAAVWSCPPGTALQLPGQVPVRVPGQPRHAVGVRVAAVADRHRRFPLLRRAGREAAARDPALHAGARRAAAGTRTGVEVRTPPVRRCQFDAVVDRHPSRPGAAPARPAHPGRTGACSARSATPGTRPCCTPTPPCCRPARRSGPRGTTSSAAAAGRRPAPGSAIT